MRSEAQVRLDLIRSTLKEMHASGGVWCWGSDEGLAPWIDRHDHMVIPVWPSSTDASQECASDSEEGEGPIFLTTQTFLSKYDKFEIAGIEEIAISPQEGKFLWTMSLDEFREALETGRRRPTGNLP